MIEKHRIVCFMIYLVNCVHDLIGIKVCKIVAIIILLGILTNPQLHDCPGGGGTPVLK